MAAQDCTGAFLWSVIIERRTSATSGPFQVGMDTRSETGARESYVRLGKRQPSVNPASDAGNQWSLMATSPYLGANGGNTP